MVFSESIMGIPNTMPTFEKNATRYDVYLFSPEGTKFLLIFTGKRIVVNLRRYRASVSSRRSPDKGPGRLCR